MAVAKRQRLSLAPVRSGSREKRVGYHGRPVADRPRTCRGKRDAVRGWKEKIVAAILPSECDPRRLSFPEQLRLIFTNVSRAQAIWGTVETSRKFLDGTDVTAYGSRKVVTTLEFLQHHFAKSGHGDLLMTRQPISILRQPLLRPPHA